MYAINLTGAATLITPPEVLKKTATNNNLDAGKLLPAIEIAELRFLYGADALGPDYYAALGAEKNRTVTSGNIASLQAAFNAQAGNTVTLQVGDVVNAAEFLGTDNRLLWDTILWKYVAECVHYMALTENYADFNSSGIQKNNPIASAVASTTAESVGISLADLKYLKNNWLQERIEPLRVALTGWLTKNIGSYPTWAGCLPEGARMTAYVDIYGDGDNACGCVYRGNNPGRHHGPSRCCDWGSGANNFLDL